MLQTIDFEIFEIEPGETVVDLGCGTGRHCKSHEIKKASIFPIDKNKKSIRNLKKSLSEQETQNDYTPLYGDAHHLPFANKSIDKVICSEVLEHIPQPNKILREINRILKPDGELAISVPTFFSEIIIDSLADKYLGKPGGHVHVFRKKEIIEKVENSGFEIWKKDSAHSLHVFYWSLRAIFGIEEENNLLPNLYKSFLDYTYGSETWQKIENSLNQLVPKSHVFYARKPSS